MPNQPLGRVLLALAMLAVASMPASAQITSTWYDINPSRSNNSNPNGASGGRVNHVSASSDFTRVYAATELGGLYTSFDQGVTWVRINTFKPTATWDVKVDPSNSKRVYATSFFDGRVQPQSGINISDDAGVNWRAVNIPGLNRLNCLQPRAVNEPSGWQIAINASNTRTVFAGTSCGLGRSLDGGANWAFIDPSPGDGSAEQVYSVIAHGSQIVDVITDNGHFRSNDNGTTWSAVPVAGPVAGNSGVGTTVTVSPAESYVLLAANTQSIPNPAGGPNLVGNNIWESDDGGATWPTSLTPPFGTAQGRFPFIKTNPTSTSSQFDVWFGDVNVFRTTATTPTPPAQGGSARTPSSWTSEQTGAHADVGDVLFDPRFGAGACPSLFSSDGGVFRNTKINNPDCQTPSWTQPTITPHATWLFGMDGIRQIPSIHAVTYGLQDDGGWAATAVAEGHNPPPPDWNNYTCCDIDQNTHGATILSLEGFFGGARSFLLFRRDRAGNNPNQISPYPSPALLAGFTRFQNAQFGATGAVINLGVPSAPGAGGTGVYFTNDITAGTIGWTSLNAPTAALSTTGNVRIANLGGRPNVYYHTGSGNPESSGVIFRSTLVANTGAAGANWTPLTLPAGIANATVWDVDPNDGRRVIISGITAAVPQTFQIWRTADFGANWQRLNSLENLMVGATRLGPTFLNQVTQGKNTSFGFGYFQPTLLKFDPLDSTTLVAGAMDSGAFVSLDNGDNWSLISNPITPTSASPHVPRPVFAYFSPGRFAATTNAFDVWVGTSGWGVMKVVLERPAPTP
jgi:hypothetical protein